MLNIYHPHGGEFTATALEFGGWIRDPRSTVYFTSVVTRKMYLIKYKNIHLRTLLTAVDPGPNGLWWYALPAKFLNN